MKIETIESIFVVLVFIVFISGFAYFLLTVQQLQKDQLKLSCGFGKLKVISNILGEIEDATAHQQLCSNQNCTDYFQGVVDKKNRLHKTNRRRRLLRRNSWEMAMTNQPRLVPEEDLVEEGYLRRGAYLIKRYGDIETRFISVHHGLYEYDGQRDVGDDPNQMTFEDVEEVRE